MNKILGFTLIEIMMTIFLSSFILVSLTTIFLASKKNDDAESNFLQLQDNISMAASLLTRAIQLANKIEPYQGPEIKPSTESFTVYGANMKSAALTESMRDLMTISLNKNQKFSLHDVVVISDGIMTEIFTIKEIKSNTSNQVIITENPLNKLYEKHAEASMFETRSFFIGKTNRMHSDGSPIYALYAKDSHGKNEFIENVEDMQVRYAFLDHQILKEGKAQKVSDWSAVLSVSITLLFSSKNFKKNVYIYAALRE